MRIGNGSGYVERKFNQEAREIGQLGRFAASDGFTYVRLIYMCLHIDNGLHFQKKKKMIHIYICIILSKSLERTFASSIYLSRNYSDGYVLNFRKLKLTDKSFHFSLLAILRRIAQTVLKFLFFSWSMEGSGVRGSSKFMSLQDSPWDMPADTMTVTPLWSRLFRYR